MRERFFQFLVFITINSSLFSQENNEEAFRKTFRSELKVVEAKLNRRPNDVNLNYKYGLLCYKLCKYREAQKALYKCLNDYKDNPYFYLDLYHVELALKNKEQAEDYYYKYYTINKKLGLETSFILKHRELSSTVKPTIIAKNQTSKDYFPYVLNNGKIKFLTQSEFSYTEPTSPLLTRNYLTNEVVFSDSSFQNQKSLTQPSKTSDGFSFHAFCLNKAQDKIYMTRYDGGNRRMIICVSNKVELRWQPFRTISYISKNSKANFMHPMLTENENQMIFASDLKGGNGGYDLWIADLSENEEFTKVKNLGDQVNTIGNELFPTKYDENTFFFSSDGHPGYGSLDLYQCDIQNQKLSKPINLGPSFNSTRDEYGLFYAKDGRTGYFTSNRSVGNANLFIDKIYKIKLSIFDCEILDLEIKNPFSTKESIAIKMDDNSKVRETKADESLSTQNYATEQPISSTSTVIPDKSTDIPPIIAANEVAEPENSAPMVSNEPAAKNEPENVNDYSSIDVQKIIEASEILLGNKNKVTSPSESQQKNPVTLYETKNDKIEEKFVRFSDNTSIASMKTEAIVENKFWTTAKLWFKDYNLPIGYSYVRVISPKNEVVYSNYSSENGMISVEVVESNEYTIEIPRFKTMLKRVVFTSGDNNLYFPYESNQQTVNNSNVVVQKNRESKVPPKKLRTRNEGKRKPIKLGLSISKNTTNNSRTNTPAPRSKNTTTKPTKKKIESKSTPRNMIENFN